MDFFATRRAIRLGILHYGLTVLLLLNQDYWGNWAEIASTIMAQPLMVAWFWLEALHLPRFMQWPLLLLNSIMWGYTLMIIGRQIKFRFLVWYYRRQQAKALK